MSKTLKLFCLRDGKGGVVVKGEDGLPVYFSDKMQAKNSRQEGQVVSYGIDHKKYKGDIS
jgi:hypothetical protein